MGCFIMLSRVEVTRNGVFISNRIYWTIIIITIIIIMVLQSSVGPWPFFQFLNPKHSR
jgi:hypothetical protein